MGVEITMTEPSASGKFEPPAGLSTDWSVDVVDLDTGKTVPPGVSGAMSLDYDRHVPTTVRGAEANRTDHHGEFALSVRWNGSEIGGGMQVGNYKATIKLKATVKTHTEEREFVVYSLVPDAIALVSGYDLQARKGVFPDRLVGMIEPLLHSFGCSVSRQDLLADLNGGRPESTELAPLWTLLSGRRRTAGILRQVVNTALADRTMEGAEFELMMRALGNYKRECSGGF
jgi:hypothetical protein